MTDDTPSINIEGASHPILCGRCKTPVVLRREADGQGGDVRCPDCGNLADVEQAAQIALEFAKDELQLRLNRAARDAARESKLLNFSGQTEHNKAHRFIVDF